MEVHEILERNIVSENENVVIALHKPSWDAKLKRGTTSTFSNNRKSCSRPAILDISIIIDLFRSEIGGGNIHIEGYGTIGVSEIVSIGMSGASQVDFLVTEDPTPTNAAHAEIVAFEPGRGAIKRNVPKGICNKLCEALVVSVL